MNTKTFRKIFRSTVISQITACLVANIANTVDSGITGKFLGGDAVAAIGYCVPLILLYLSLANLLAFGAQLWCSKYIGTNEPEKVKGQFTASLIMIITVAVTLAVVYNVFSRELAIMLGAEGEYMISLTAEYLCGISYGILPIYLFVLITPLCNIDGNTSLPIISVAVLVITDVVFDFANALWIHGGIYGMGIASSLSYVISAIVICSHLFTKKCSFKFSTKNVKASMFGKTFVGGLPASIQCVGLACLSLLINHLITDGTSTVAVASFNIAFSITTMLLSIPNGLAPAVVTFTGVFLGEEDKNTLKTLQKESLKISLIWNTVAYVALFFAARPLVTLFSDEEELITVATLAVRLMSTQLVVYSIDTCLQNYFMVVGEEKLMILMSFLSNFGFCAIAAVCFNPIMGTNGIWLCYTVGKILSIVALLVIATLRNGSFPKTADEWLLLPKPFGKTKLCDVSYSVKTTDDAVAVSKKIWDFCTENGATVRTKYILSLLAEEFGNNAVQYGFSGSKENDKQLDISLSLHTDCWKIRLRDNGKLFNPIRYLELNDDNNPEHNIGIKMATKAATDIKYLNTFSLNNITLTINR